MGLTIVVGLWPAGPNADPEALAWAREDLEQVNRMLDLHGLPPHDEPRTPPRATPRTPMAEIPYEHLHLLRRAAALARQAPDQFGPASRKYDPAKDDRIEREFTELMDSHLICHSDSDGFYVPVDFPVPLCDEDDDEDNEAILGGILGSSPRALDELLDLAPLLGIALEDGALNDAEAALIAADRDGSNPYLIERAVWLALHDAFRLSVEHRCLVVFA